MSYIVNTCHRTRFAGGLEALNGADADAANYLNNRAYLVRVHTPTTTGRDPSTERGRVGQATGVGYLHCETEALGNVTQFHEIPRKSSGHLRNYWAQPCHVIESERGLVT